MDVSVYISSMITDSLGFGFEISEDNETTELSEADTYYILQECLYENYDEFEDALSNMQTELKREGLHQIDDDYKYNWAKKNIQSLMEPITVEIFFNEEPGVYHFTFDIRDVFLDVITLEVLGL